MPDQLPAVGDVVAHELPDTRRGRKPWPPRVVAEDDQAITLQLQQLLQLAMAGEIKGLVVGIHYGGEEYAYAGSGTFCQQPNRVETIITYLRSKFITPFTGDTRQKKQS